MDYFLSIDQGTTSSRVILFNINGKIEFISKYVTLEVGDCIFTGTSGTAGQIKSGDEVIVEIENVGKLINNCS